MKRKASSSSIFPKPSSAPPKRRKVGTEDDDEDDLAAFFGVTDTQAYMELLKNASKAYKLPYPFMLRSQLYGAMQNHTMVDRDLDTLVTNGDVKCFEIFRGDDDNVVLFVEDWIQTIQAAKMDYLQGIVRLNHQLSEEKKAEEKDGHQLQREVSVPSIASANIFDLFCERVVPVWHECTIDEPLLLQLLRGKDQREVSSMSLTPLVNSGTLLFRDTGLYGFGIPGAGPFLIHCKKGRDELIRFLRKCPFQQVSLQKLLQRKCRTSKLPWRFHVYSALGKQEIEKVESPDGTILRILAPMN